jgi:hypothetical protein
MQYNNNDNKEKIELSDKDDDDNTVESKLIRQTNEEEKSRKRTRGPYRKSSRSIIRAHD